MNVSLDPKRVVTSVLTPVLSADILNPVGRDIINGMGYESGTYKPIRDNNTATVSFKKQHKNPPFLILVYSNDEIMITKTTYGELFIDCLELYGAELKKPDPYPPAYGIFVTWRTANTTAIITTSYSTLQSEAALRTHATKTYFVFGGGESDVYVRARKTYDWIAVFMPE